MKELTLQDYITPLIEQIRFSCMVLKHGGPFGALVFKQENDKIIPISVGYNRVLVDHDPTAHAEIVAIREACKALHTHDLSGCNIYASGYPCPMCMSAILWSNINNIYYSGTYEQAADIGFRDEFILKFLKNNCKNEKILIQHIPNEELLQLYKDFSTLNINY